MARRRYISTKASTDKECNKLAMEYGDFAALLYFLMIPHCEDDATLTGDPDELLATVAPMRRDKSPEDVAAALQGMENLGLIRWDRENSTVFFPESFYTYQTYIPPAKRRSFSQEPAQNAEDIKQSAQISEQQRKTPKNAAYPSPSPSPSPDLQTDRASAGSKSSVVDLETELGIKLPQGNVQAMWLVDYCEQYPGEGVELRRILDAASDVRNPLRYLHGIATERKRRRDFGEPLERESAPPPNSAAPSPPNSHPFAGLPYEEVHRRGMAVLEKRIREDEGRRIAQQAVKH